MSIDFASWVSSYWSKIESNSFTLWGLLEKLEQKGISSPSSPNQDSYTKAFELLSGIPHLSAGEKERVITGLREVLLEQGEEENAEILKGIIAAGRVFSNGAGALFSNASCRNLEKAYENWKMAHVYDKIVVDDSLLAHLRIVGAIDASIMDATGVNEKGKKRTSSQKVCYLFGVLPKRGRSCLQITAEVLKEKGYREAGDALEGFFLSHREYHSPNPMVFSQDPYKESYYRWVKEYVYKKILITEELLRRLQVKNPHLFTISITDDNAINICCVFLDCVMPRASFVQQMIAETLFEYDSLGTKEAAHALLAIVYTKHVPRSSSRSMSSLGFYRNSAARQEAYQKLLKKYEQRIEINMPIIAALEIAGAIHANVSDQLRDEKTSKAVCLFTYLGMADKWRMKKAVTVFKEKGYQEIGLALESLFASDPGYKERHPVSDREKYLLWVQQYVYERIKIDKEIVAALQKRIQSYGNHSLTGNHDIDVCALFVRVGGLEKKALFIGEIFEGLGTEEAKIAAKALRVILKGEPMPAFPFPNASLLLNQRVDNLPSASRFVPSSNNCFTYERWKEKVYEVLLLTPTFLLALQAQGIAISNEAEKEIEKKVSRLGKVSYLFDEILKAPNQEERQKIAIALVEESEQYSVSKAEELRKLAQELCSLTETATFFE